ncbi:hypothetical protein [Enterococcus sp. AZ012]|uniref:hypothetical protein n=1 Tax=unclassified Enterococcus TaxID=2608891 RepID=UPI003D2D069E
MRKTYFITFLVSIFMSFSLSVETISADDNLREKNTMSAQVIGGDISFSIENAVIFESQILSSHIDIGSKDIDYVVTDYSGTVDGYEITAKLLDTDPTRILKINDVELSDVSNIVVLTDSNSIGENSDTLNISLEYRGISEAKTYTSIIEWTFSSSQTSEIFE